jgi:hypothetical protein
MLNLRFDEYLNDRFGQVGDVGIMCPATIFKITWNYFIFGIPHCEDMCLFGMELNILAGIYLVHVHV